MLSTLIHKHLSLHKVPINYKDFVVPAITQDYELKKDLFTVGLFVLIYLLRANLLLTSFKFYLFTIDMAGLQIAKIGLKIAPNMVSVAFF